MYFVCFLGYCLFCMFVGLLCILYVCWVIVYLVCLLGYCVATKGSGVVIEIIAV